MCAMQIRQRMQERTERLSWAIRALRPAPKEVEVEKPQIIICCGTGGGMGTKNKFTCRAPRRHGRF